MKNLVLMLGLYMCLHMLISHIMSLQALILDGEWKKVAIFSIFLESMGRGETRTLWSIGRQCGFTDRFLLGSYNEGQFKERTRVKFATFKFLSEKLVPFLHNKNTPMKNAIFVETRIAISLSRLGTGNGQLLIGNLYRVAESTVSVLMREFFKAVRQHL